MKNSELYKKLHKKKLNDTEILSHLRKDNETFSPLNESVLKEADRLINGDRQKSYSHPTDDYTKTVGAFNALTGHKLTVKEGMMFMVCVKLSRECYKAKRDNLVDACGYLGCIEKHEDRLKKESSNA